MYATCRLKFIVYFLTLLLLTSLHLDPAGQFCPYLGVDATCEKIFH